ncbi:MAG: glycerol-3-phosphate 1-O-acyltransferase PlsY [Bacilli bacterium]
MQIFYFILFLITSIISGYLVGSISFAVLITKHVYNIDIYAVGSGNAGGTNVGRAIGKYGAYSVIFLDALKCIIPIWTWFALCTFTPIGDLIPASISQGYIYYSAGFGAALGHTFPLYHKFKGGKAVSCYVGFVVATNPMLLVIGLPFFLLMFLFTKRVSICSILTVIFGFLYSLVAVLNPAAFEWTFFFGNGYKVDTTYVYSIYMALYALFIIYMHRSNIKRLINHTEPETHYKKNKKN